MIETIYSVHILTHSLIDIPDEIGYIFKTCNDFLGDMYMYKVFMENMELILITNIPRNNLTIYDKIEFLRIFDEIQNNIKNTNDNNLDQIHKWKSRTIYLKKNYDEDYEYINFFDIFPSINNFSLKFYFDFNHNKFMFSDKKSGPHFTEKQINNIISVIKWKKDPFVQTPMIEPPIDILY